MRVIALVAIVCACLLLWGAMFDGPDRLGVTTVSQKSLMTVVVTFKHVTDDYRWLSVQGCSADITENGALCNGNFELQSSRELFGRKQELIDWRNVPRGSMLITAQAFSLDRHLLASGSTVLLRGE